MDYFILERSEGIELDKVAVVLVNYNGGKYCQKCIDSIMNQTYPDIDIIFVDNASVDGSVSLIKKEFCHVKVIALKKNMGFTGGNNIGIKKAIERNADYLLLLNTDTELMDRNLVSRMVEEADENTAVIPAIYSDRQKKAIWYTGGKLDRKNAMFLNTGNYDNVRYPIYVSYMVGCCMFIHKDIFAKVGLFDESFFLYCEDGELSVRMYRAGVKMKYLPDVWVWHKVQFRRSGSYFIYYFNRNYYYTLDKNKDYFGVTVKESILKDIKLIINNFLGANFYKNKYIMMAIIDYLIKRKGKRKKIEIWKE